MAVVVLVLGSFVKVHRVVMRKVSSLEHIVVLEDPFLGTVKLVVVEVAVIHVLQSGESPTGATRAEQERTSCKSRRCISKNSSKETCELLSLREILNVDASRCVGITYRDH
eukprot:372507-Hanusia_phi.AAC.2